MEQEYLIQLRKILDERFDEEELRTLCFDLQVDYASLPGEGKAGKARELITYFQRRGCLTELEDEIKRRRPDVPKHDQAISFLDSRVFLVSVITLASLVAIGVIFRSTIRDLLDPPDFKGKVCQIESGWDTNTVFLRQAEFNKLALPVGTRITVVVRDTGKRFENVTLSLNSDLQVCSVRLSKPLREALGVKDDTEIQPESRRPNRKFDIAQTAPPTNEEIISFSGKVCMIRQEHDADTLFLRQVEFNDLNVPAGTTVSITVQDTGRTVQEINLSLDKELGICAIRLSEEYRIALGVNDDVKIEPESSRPNHQISITVPRP